MAKKEEGATENKAATIIADVIDAFEAFAYDDSLLGRKYLHELIVSHGKDLTQPIDQDAIKRIIIDESTHFSAVITNRKKKDMIWSYARDLRYGHHYVLQWIMGRWFMAAEKFEDLPPWYQIEVKHVRESPREKDVQESVDEMLARLQTTTE